VTNKGLIAGLGLGTGLMYFLDPDRGKRRRAMVRDQAARIARKTSRFADKAIRDVANRTHGLAIETESLFKREPISDAVLEARVQTRLGRLVSRPNHIQVSVSSGVVKLEGTVIPNEMSRVISGIAAMQGVTGVTNRLQPFGAPRRSIVSSTGSAKEFLNGSESWAPAARVAFGLAGGVATAAGLWLASNRGTIAAMLTVSGTGLMARSVANQRLTQLAGLAPTKHH
jgi:hypothetical protein